MQKVSGCLNRRCHGTHRDPFQPGAVRKGLLMAGISLPWLSTFRAGVPRVFGWAGVLMPLLLVTGCASWHRPSPIPAEITEAGVAARLLVPPDLNVNPAETVVKPGGPSGTSNGSAGASPSRPALSARSASAVGLMGSPLGWATQG